MLSLNWPESVISELLCGDYLVLMCETINGLRNKFFKWKEAFMSKGWKVNLGKTKVMVNGSITTEGMSISKDDPCGVCSLWVKAYSVLCVHFGKWIHGRCAREKRMFPKFFRNFECRKYEGYIGEAVEHEKKLCDEVETKGIHISWWQCECWWKMWGRCDCQNKTWLS